MTSIAKTKALNIGLTDAGAILLIFLVPTLSHLTAVPFYLADPMRLAVLGALLHQKAGRLACEKLGAFSMLPSDVIEMLPQAITSL